MNIKSITIILEPEFDDEKHHATILEFKEGCWTANGPVFNRFIAAQAEIFRLLRRIK